VQLRHGHGANGVALLVLARLARLELAAAEHQVGGRVFGEARAIAAQHDNYSGDVGHYKISEHSSAAVSIGCLSSDSNMRI